MLKKLFFTLLLACTFGAGFSQELQARVTVLANRVSTQVDKKIFNTLQASIYDFLNNRKWTTDVYQPNEKIDCSFFL